MRGVTAAIRAIVFDFDGVIVESLDVKTEAFRALFAEHPEHVDAIVKLHVDNLGVSRHEKFRIIYRDFLRRPLDDEEMERLARRFSTLVFEQVLSCPFVPGAPEFLEKAASRYALYVASATPEEELRRVVSGRGLDGVFRGAYGSPGTKEEILGSILERHRFRPDEAIFIGDAMTDYDGARHHGVPFIGRVPPNGPSPFDGGEVDIVADLAELDRRWDEILARLEAVRR